MATKKKSSAKKSSKKLPTVRDIAGAAKKEGFFDVSFSFAPPPQAAFIGTPVTVTFKDKDTEDLKGIFPVGTNWNTLLIPFEAGGGKVLLNQHSIDQIWLDAPSVPLDPPAPEDPVGVDV